jgi:hypothetical protein
MESRKFLEQHDTEGFLCIDTMCRLGAAVVLRSASCRHLEAAELEERERGEAAQRSHPSVRHLVAATEGEGRQSKDAAHSSQPRVLQVDTVAEVERRQCRQADHCSQPLVRKTRSIRPFTSSDTTAGKLRTSMRTASSVVCRLSTSRITSASCTAFHPAQTSRTVAEV